MDEQQKRKRTWTVVEQPVADVHTTTSMPGALRLYAKQVAVVRPPSLVQVVNAHRERTQKCWMRVERYKKDEQVLLEFLSRGVHGLSLGFMGVSISLVAVLVFLAWMVSGPVKASILALALFVLSVVF